MGCRSGFAGSMCGCPEMDHMKKREAPRVEITNGILTGRIFLPDPARGYYRGSRFDWSGVIESLRFEDHEYFGRWYDRHDPEHHDAIVGPVDAFLPVGFDNAPPGGTFLMIGVGVVEKTHDGPWEFVRRYPLADGGRWTVRRARNRVCFTQVLRGTDYAYRYEKTVVLTPGKPVMKISHALRNDGPVAIRTESYNHNFFVIDRQPVGPAYAAEFPAPVRGRFMVGAGLVQKAGRRFALTREFLPSENIYCEAIGGRGKAGRVYDFRIESPRTGAGVRVTCDKPAVRIAFWANPVTFCPEPYVSVQAEPGETVDWTLAYEFYETNRL